MEYKKTIANYLLTLFLIHVLFLSTIQAGVSYNNKNKNSINNVVKSKNYQSTESSWSGQNNAPNPNFPSNTIHSARQFLEKAKHFSKNYKTHIILFSLLGSYGTTYYLLFRGNNYLKSESLWSSWPINRTLHTLLEIPQEKLAVQLLDEIQLRYNGHQNFIDALTQFKEAIDKEKSNLLFYDKLYKFLDKSYLISIFPVSVERFKEIKKRLERIAYLKNIFLSWSTTLPAKAKESVKKKPKKISSSGQTVSDDDKLHVNINNEFCPNTLNYLSSSNIQNAVLKCVAGARSLPGYVSDWIKHAGKKSKEFYLENQVYIIPGAILTSYSTLCIALRNGNQYIKHHTFWAHWNKEKTLGQLMQVSEEQLLYELMLEIQKRHVNTHYPVDFISPLAAFMKELEQEKKKLLFYSKLYNFLKKSYTLYVFPIETNNFAKTKILLARLSFIRDIFLNWIAQYNIEQNALPKKSFF